jgi:hypothetical protein
MLLISVELDTPSSSSSSQSVLLCYHCFSISFVAYTCCNWILLGLLLPMVIGHQNILVPMY